MKKKIYIKPESELILVESNLMEDSVSLADKTGTGDTNKPGSEDNDGKSGAKFNNNIWDEKAGSWDSWDE